MYYVLGRRPETNKLYKVQGKTIALCTMYGELLFLGSGPGPGLFFLFPFPFSLLPVFSAPGT
jgi:hypothetical protein